METDGGTVSKRALESMLAAAAHRGPDGSGTWVGNGAGLGHLALKITPEEQDEVQPLADTESGLVISADARIDNREDLIAQLGSDLRGEGASVSDARLILIAYRRWGEACVERLLGDFAFVIWDSRKPRVFAARDAMGMRALYYCRTPNKLYFSTDIAQILGQPGVPLDLDECMVAAHLTSQPMPLEQTFYRGIGKLPAGHALTFEDGRQRVWRYWDVDPGQRLRYRSDEEYAEHFRELFKEAVRCRLRSVKPGGLMLSGGLDSGSIAATGGWLLQEEGQQPGLRTYSYAYEGFPQCDEREISRLTTAAHGLPACEVPVEGAHPFHDYTRRAVDRDEPSMLVFQALHERVFEQARADCVGVMMSGYRGDLVMGCEFDVLGLLTSGRWGTLFETLKQESRSYRRLPKAVAKFVVLPALMPFWPLGRLTVRRRRLWTRMIGQRVVPPYPDWMNPAFPEHAGLADAVQRVEAPAGMTASAIRQRYEAIFMEVHMRGIPQLARSHARFGLEFADPWSDRRLAEFVLATPQYLLHQVKDEKRMTRLAMTGVMPEAVRRSARKISPGPFYHDALLRTARNTVLDLTENSQAAARGFVDERKVRALYESVCRGERGLAGLWEYLSLEIWLRAHWR